MHGRTENVIVANTMSDSEQSGANQSDAEAADTAPQISEELTALLLIDLGVRRAWMDIVIVVVAVLTMSYVIYPVLAELAWRPQDEALLWWLWHLVNVALTVGLALFLTRSSGLSIRALGFRTQNLVPQFLWGIGAVAVTYAAMFAFALGAYALWRLWPQTTPTAPTYRPVAFVNTEFSTGSALALMVVIAVAEETLFRGILLTRLRRALGAWWPAVILSSVAFGVMHLPGGVLYGISALIFSLVWATFFILSRSLITAMFAHFLFNSAQLFVYRHLAT